MRFVSSAWELRRDATAAMPEQILTTLERHARRAKPAAEGVLETVGANLVNVDHDALAWVM